MRLTSVVRQRKYRALSPIALCASLFTVASVQADDLPMRKAGHWRITSISAELGMTMIDACIRPGDSIVAPSDGRACSDPVVSRTDEETIVNLTCTFGQGEERISTLFTGDFETWYRGITKMTFDPPSHGMARMAVTVDAKFVSSVCPD